MASENKTDDVVLLVILSNPVIEICWSSDFAIEKDRAS